MSKIRILIVDDHPLMREALRAAIVAEDDLEVVGQAPGGAEAVQLARGLEPDLTIMDLLMPGTDGLQAIAAIHAERPQARILAFTSSTDESKVLAAVQAGALGYILKDAHREELLSAIRQVSQGHAYLPSAVALKLIHGVRHPPAELPPTPEGEVPLGRLTARQKEVLELLTQGLSTQEVAAKLVLSEATVRSHIFHLLGALGLENRRQAVAHVLRRGGTSALPPALPD